MPPAANPIFMPGCLILDGKWSIGHGRILNALARLKGVRGTMLDPLGHTAERRAERALIAEYEQTIETIIANLTPANHGLAAALLMLPDGIRGFGPVKAEVIDRYREARAIALTRFLEEKQGSAVA